MSGDYCIREEYTPRLESCIDTWSEIVRQIPPAWLYADDDMTAPINFKFDKILESLERYKSEEFWTW